MMTEMALATKVMARPRGEQEFDIAITTVAVALAKGDGRRQGR